MSGDRPKNNMAILLLLFLVESQALGHQCSTAVFPHCTNNSVLRVTKSTEMYQVTLQATEWQCYNDFCLLNDQKYRQKNIMCNDVCGVCRQLQPPGHNYGKSAESMHISYLIHELVHNYLNSCRLWNGSQKL